MNKKNFQETVESDSFKTVECSMRNAEKYLMSLNNAEQEGQIIFQPDVSVILVSKGNTFELNKLVTDQEHSRYVQTEFLSIGKGKDLLNIPQTKANQYALKDDNHQLRTFIALSSKVGDDVLIVSKNVSHYKTFIKNSELLFLGLLIASIIMITIYTIHQRRYFYSPIEELTDLAYEYSENNFSHHKETTSNDMIGHLETAINKLGKVLETNSLMNKRERELMTHIYDSLDIGIIYVTKENIVFPFNVEGKDYYTAFIKSDDQEKRIKDSYRKLIHDAIVNKKNSHMEVQQNHLIYDLEFSPVASLTGVVIFIKDITSAKQLLSIREDLITNVSHDLRTPLATIQGYSEAIKDDIAETIQEKNEMAQIIHEEASQMNHMITRLLEVSSIKAGESTVDKKPVHLAEFFNGVMHRFSQTLKSEGIQCELEIADNISYFSMDADKMHRVFYNLIDNAIKYAADPRTRESRFIKITVNFDGLIDELFVTVSDNGIGISKESIPYIFERFYKDDKARTKPKTNGSGIGLSIVENIIKEHSGTISVKSLPDVGTCFMIRLPLLDDTIE